MLQRHPVGRVRDRLTRLRGAASWIGCSGLVAISLVLASSSSCASAPPPRATEPPILRIGLALPGVNSNVSVGRSVVAYLLAGSRLLQEDRDGRYRSDVSHRWAVAPDGLSVTFEIRSDARFPDGSELTPAIVKSFLDEMLQSARLASFAVLQNIAAVRVEAPDRVVLELHEPSSVLLSNLDLPITKQTADGRSVGVGPFSLESESSDVTVLRANPYYHDGPPRISAIHLRSYPTVRAAWAAMMRGESDFLYRVPNDAREFLERQTSIATLPVLQSNVFSLVFNARRQIFASPTVRRALSMAVDRQEIVDLALRRHGQPATGYLWPTHWAVDASAQSFDYQPLEALRLLTPSAVSGTTRRVSNIPRDQRLRFSCLIPEGVSPHDRVAIVLQKQLFEIGVDMTIEPVPVRELIDRLADGDYDTALLDLNSGTGLARLYPYWHSSSASFADLGYDAADGALEALRAATADDAIAIAIHRVQQVFYDDPPAIFLCWPETTRAVHRRFVVPDPDLELDLATSVARWYPAALRDEGS